MKLGCHAVLFGEKIKTEPEAVLGGLAETGCQGVEIGARFFGVDRRQELRGFLEGRGLVLSGFHVSFCWTDLLDRPEEVREVFEKAGAFLQTMPEKNIIATGVPAAQIEEYMTKGPDIRLTQTDTLKKMALCLDGIAAGLGEKGVTFNYHNHSWEFERKGQMYYALLNHASHVSFGLDTGWAAVSGYDPVNLIEEAPERFAYVHLRDYKKEHIGGETSFAEKREAFVDVGTGDMDFARLFTALQKALGDTGWAVIEYETGEVSFDRYKRAADYLKQHGFGVQG